MFFLVKAVSLIMALVLTLVQLPGSRKPVFDGDATVNDKLVYDEGTADIKANDIVVSCNASDGGAGTVNDPVSFAGALKMLGEREADNVTVWFKEGIYCFNDTIALNSEYGNNIVFRSFPGEKVVFSGAEAISGFSETVVNGVTAWVTDCEGNFNTLYKDSKRLERPVYPENGAFKVKDVSDSDAYLYEPSGYYALNIAFYADTKDLVGFKNPGDTETRIMHWWKDELLPVHSVDTETGRVEVTKPASMIIKPGNNYVFENVFEALNEPGEWYLDKTDKKLYYIPEADDDIDTLVLYAGTTEQLMTVDGMANVTFAGIDFKYTERRMYNGSSFKPDRPFPDFVKWSCEHSQAASDAPCAIVITDSDNIKFENCRFNCIGSSCLMFGYDTHGCSVVSSEFTDIGGNAVYVTGENDVSAPEDTVTSDITVYDCHINGYGKVYNNAVGVFIRHAKNCTVSHNEIHDGLYTAVSVGWTWGYYDNVTDGNIIEYNLIYDIGNGWLSDMGGIYTLGVQPKTILRGNVIHDIGCYGGSDGYGGWGIYLDEGSSYILVENNLCYNCSSQGFHQHYGKDNMLVNNIFAMNGNGQFRITKKEDHNSLTIKNNIFVSDGTLMFASVRKGQYTDSGNLYWDCKRKANVISSQSDNAQFFKILTVAEMKAYGYYKHSVIADPLFRDISNNDFTLADNSPAVKMGFKPIDYTLAGTVTKF